MNTKKNNKVVLAFAALAFVLVATGCGKKPLPPPPPPPPTNTGGFAGGSCGAPGGVTPLSRQPYQTRLAGMMGSLSNSMTLNASFTDQYAFERRYGNVAVGAQFVMPEMAQILGVQYLQNYTFCASTTMPGVSQPSYGFADQRMGTLSATLYGMIQVPMTVMSPFGNTQFPGITYTQPQQQMMQAPVIVEVGSRQGCIVQVSEGGVLNGCIYVTIGNRPPARFEASPQNMPYGGQMPPQYPYGGGMGGGYPYY